LEPWPTSFDALSLVLVAKFRSGPYNWAVIPTARIVRKMILKKLYITCLRNVNGFNINISFVVTVALFLLLLLPC